MPLFIVHVSLMATKGITFSLSTKVNQQRRVIESLINAGEPLGLEAGSKAELMAVLAHANMTSSVIVL